MPGRHDDMFETTVEICRRVRLYGQNNAVFLISGVDDLGARSDVDRDPL